MTLRRKLVTLICLIFAAAIVIMFFISQAVLMSRFEDLEKQNTTQNVQRAASALYADFSTISIEFSSLMVESQCFSVVQNGNDMYMKVNVDQPAFETMRLNYILFVMSPATPPQGMGFDLETGESLPIPTTLVQELARADCPLSQSPSVSDKGITGILTLQDSTLLVQSYPILVTTDFGPLKGRVIFLRFLDETELARLAQQTHLSLSLYRLDDPQMPDDFEVAQSSLSEQVPTFVKPLGANSVAGYGLMEDVYGDPAMMLRADMDRGIYRQGQNTVIWLIAFLAAASVAFAAVAIFLINRVLLSRIFAISDGVSKVRTTGDLSRRVPGKGKDEIDSLGANINRMLASLQESQRELLESEAQNSALVNAIPDMMFRMTKNGTLLDAKAFKSSIKKGFSTRPPFISDGGSSLQYDMLSIEVVQHGMPHVQRALETRETQIFEFALNFNGRVANYEARVALSGKDEALVMVRNITERKEAEEARKKEVLLKEIHHRVKNNLQVISSLLYLQSKRVDDQKVVEMFNESSNRIKSMSLIHQKLYQSQNAATIDFSEYIRDLTDALFNSYGIRRDVVRLNLHIESTILNVDTAIPCGLVINELVSNSLKYAFPDGKQGQIFISLRREGDDNFALVIGDTGIGLPKGLDFRDSPSLGLKLVNTLVEQLGGTIDLNREGGTEFRIIFSEIKQQSHNDAREPVRASSGTVG